MTKLNENSVLFLGLVTFAYINEKNVFLLVLETLPKLNENSVFCGCNWIEQSVLTAFGILPSFGQCGCKWLEQSVFTALGIFKHIECFGKRNLT